MFNYYQLEYIRCLNFVYVTIGQKGFKSHYNFYNRRYFFAYNHNHFISVSKFIRLVRKISSEYVRSLGFDYVSKII